MAMESRSTRRSTLAHVTSLAAFTATLSAIIDAITDSRDDPLRPWAWVWITAGVVITVAPALLGRRFPWQIGFVGCVLLVVVTSLQVATSTDRIAVVDNLVFYPLIGCYAGWFFRRWCARSTVVVAFAASGVGLLINPHGSGLWVTWTNLIFVCFFCLETTIHLRRVSNRRIETDPLTGVLNRFGYFRVAAAALSEVHRTTSYVTAVLIDIDHFKQVNDTQGHAAGDHALIGLAASVRAALRRIDHIARIGGDEFVVLLPGMSVDDTHAFIDRLYWVSDCSFSYGIAQSTPGDSPDTILARADAELYRQKQNRPGPDR